MNTKDELLFNWSASMMLFMRSRTSIAWAHIKITNVFILYLQIWIMNAILRLENDRQCFGVSLASFSFCWLRHNRLLMMSQWPENCDAITWIMISNSLDIDFIHSGIHGRSCKNRFYFPWEDVFFISIFINLMLSWIYWFQYLRWSNMIESMKTTSMEIRNIEATSKWALWRIKSPASRLFAQLFVQV